MTYDGRVDISPPDRADASIIAAVNKHQATDKGFGVALGPKAADYAVDRFEKVGYSVTRRLSDWMMGPGDRDIQMEILSGWASAAREIGALSLEETVSWLTRRRASAAAGVSSMRVGHVDFFAVPTGTR